jgi:hypothetical protein
MNATVSLPGSSGARRGRLRQHQPAHLLQLEHITVSRLTVVPPPVDPGAGEHPHEAQ